MYLSVLTVTPAKALEVKKAFDELYFAANAYVYMDKAAGTPALSYSLTGRLVGTKSGWVVLEVPMALVRGAFDALNEPGVELPPPASGYDDYKSHISVIRPEELKEIGGIDRISERGHFFSYALRSLKSVEPAGWPEMSKVWFIEVTSLALKNLRKSYGLEPLPKHQFHITIGCRRKSVLRNNDVSKAAESLLPVQETQNNQNVLERPIQEGWPAEGVQSMPKEVSGRISNEDKASTACSLRVCGQTNWSEETSPFIQHTRASNLEKDALALQQSSVSDVGSLRRTWYYRLCKMAGVPEFLSGHGIASIDAAYARTNQQQRSLRTQQLSMGNSKGTTEKQAQQSSADFRRRDSSDSHMGRENEHQTTNTVSPDKSWLVSGESHNYTSKIATIDRAVLVTAMRLSKEMNEKRAVERLEK
jgi:hypothetical protein